VANRPKRSSVEPSHSVLPPKLRNRPPGFDNAAAVGMHVRDGFAYVGRLAWRWPVFGTIAGLTYGAGVNAMFGDASQLGGCLYFVAIALVAIKLIVDARSQPKLVGISVVVIVLGIGLFFLSFLLIRRPTPQPSPLQPVFILRHKGAAVFSDFPQPLLYEYGDNALAPVGLAVNIEVINNKPVKTKITQYLADIQTRDGRWYRALSLPMSPLHTIYFLNLRRIDLGMKCHFEPAIFDRIADNKTLDPGEPLEGWAFFEWPAELRRTTVLVQKVRLSVKNAQGESTETTFDSNNQSPVEPGASSVDDGGLFCSGTPGEKIDLSNREIRPFRDD
jgi:hypothetical protein